MSMTKTKLNTKLLALSAMFAALITVATAFITISDGSGYTHPGDSIVYLAASTLPFPYGIIASAIGGFFADLLAGYPQWALITALIKAINCLPFVICRYLINNKKNSSSNAQAKNNKILNLPIILSTIPSGIITVLGYTLANILMISTEYAIANIPILCFQGIIGAGLFILLGASLDKIGFKQKLIHNN